MEGTKSLETLIRELDAQKELYLETFQKAHDLIVQNLALSASQNSVPPVDLRPHVATISRATSVLDSELGKSSATAEPTFGEASSFSKANGREYNGDESLYVQTPLESRSFSEDDLRAHLRSHKWTAHGRRILDGVVGNARRLSQVPLLPRQTGPLNDRSHYTHHQVFDVGSDGSPLQLDQSSIEAESGRAMGLWHAIKDINPACRQHRAVGRITIVREPSPILFGAVHYTMHKTFDVDELFRNLVEAELSSASMRRAFEDDERRQRTFFFNFEYFTLIGKDCQPASWQIAAGQEDRKPGYIQISRCSSVVALALSGPPLKDIKNLARRRKKDRGLVYDPFAPWQVLNIQYNPDWKATLDVHDSSKHYVNGPDAFLNTLLGEFRDAQRRFNDITKKISRRIKPALEFMFDSGVREKLLFEDDEYNTVKSYFWTHQTLGIMNESIKAMIDAFEDTFTNDVWEGKHSSIWPILDESTSRSKFFKRTMADLKSAFEIELANLRKLMDENHDRQKEIIELRDALFSGTSIQESRNAVKAAETTIQQGHNIKLLTLVSIFFLPLTFVTSVFGMSNLDRREPMSIFAIVVVTVCVPFFVLIGFLNTTVGMTFWRQKTQAFFNSIGKLFTSFNSREKKPPRLATTKSFDSQTTNAGLSLRRWTSTQRNVRAPDVHDPTSREDEQRRLDNGPLNSMVVTPSLRPTMPPDRTSRIAELWTEERKRRLKYSEEV